MQRANESQPVVAIADTWTKEFKSKRECCDFFEIGNTGQLTRWIKEQQNIPASCFEKMGEPFEFVYVEELVFLSRSDK